MQKFKSYEIRQKWLDFFKSKGHDVIPSASLIPNNDPTLLWINAGVAPLKKYFDGRETPKNPRMTNAQKSIRTNDIENVGRTSRHHTFFEMLGNFSIGDYFRDEALTWAYELLFSSEWFGIDKEKIYITFYPKDLETKNKWISLGIEESHLIPLEGNFWEIGEGPCGPDTEIFFDRGPKYDKDNIGIKLLQDDIDNDRYIEIWNIVFSQFNSIQGLDRSNYPELPSKNIDTGSGLERLACIFQETDTNYETDLFMPMIKWLEEYTGVMYQGDNKMAFRVIADHLRSVTFAIADGALISNEGRGYVLRRMVRRAVRYGKKLGITKPFLYKMVGLVVDNMKGFYKYLPEKQAIIEKLIKNEEENFFRTLESGEKKLFEIIKQSNNKKISGQDAFLLYDTFGFPIELTVEAAQDKGLSVDINEFSHQLNLQKERARAARNDEQSMNVQNEAYLSFKSPFKYVGYDVLKCSGTITGIFKGDKLLSEGKGNLVIVLDQSPFYAEMGGQVGDCGKFIIDNEAYNVINTFKLPNGEHAHIVDVKDHLVKIGDKIECIVDDEFHHKVCMNHSATHLLNEALRIVLGNHVSQHGSFVSNNRLRFDFNHYNNLSNEDIINVEKIVNNNIEKEYKVNTLVLPIEEAKKTGAQAVFGEKYGDVVRVVDMTCSKEFCGGTHVNNTAEIKKIAILGVESKGSGIFRIEATTGDNIEEAINNAIKNNKDEIVQIIKKINNIEKDAMKENFVINKPCISLPSLEYSYLDIINYRKALEDSRLSLKIYEREFDNLYRSKNSSDYKQFISLMDNNNLVLRVDNIEINVLKDIIDKITAEFDNCFVFFADIINNEKIIFIAKCKGKPYNCGMLVKKAAIVTGGNGGGRPDFAQSGGKDISKVNEALSIVKEIVK